MSAFTSAFPKYSGGTSTPKVKAATPPAKTRKPSHAQQAQEATNRVVDHIVNGDRQLHNDILTASLHHAIAGAETILSALNKSE